MRTHLSTAIASADSTDADGAHADGSHLGAGRQQGESDLLESGTVPAAADVVSAVVANELRADLERLKAEWSRLVDTQRRVMELLGTATPEKIVHDLRNLLNERELFKSLIDTL
jgi:hypothetical protein